MMEPNSSTRPTNATDLYQIYWWLAPKYFEELASRPKYLVVIESGIMLLITITAFSGNFLICFALLRNPRLRTVTNFLILTLAATDMIAACLCHTVAIIILMKGKWIVDVNPLDVKHFACQLQGIITPALVGFSLHIMCLTAINRYICVAHQNLYKKLFSKQATRFMVIFDAAILFSLGSIPYPAGFAKITLDPRRAFFFTTFQQQKSAKLIGNLFLAFFVALPLIVICLCYFRVFRVIRSSYFQVNVASTSSERKSVHPPASTAASKIAEVKITKTVFVVVLGFLTCWIPTMVCNHLSFNMVNPRFPRQGELVFTYFLCLSSAINPFIYGTTCRALRKQLWNVIYRPKTKRAEGRTNQFAAQ